MEIVLLRATALFYLVASASFILYLLLVKNRLSRLSPLVLLSGFFLHTLAIGVHFFQAGFPAIAQFREAVSFYGWLMVGLYLLVQLKYRLTVLGCFVSPLAFLMALAASASGSSGELPPLLKTFWLPVHVTFAFLGNAVFALAFGVSLIYLVHEYQLKRKKTSVLHIRFPSLETLDRLNYVLLVWGFPLMTLGIITGSLWAASQWGNYWSWESRQISSAITWLLYGGLLQGRMTAGLRGKKAALLTILGFVFVLGYFLWGNALFPSRHSGRFE